MTDCNYCTINGKCVGFDDCPHMKSEHQDCICKGNWRQLVKECEPLFGKKYTYQNDPYGIYIFFGLVYDNDDYYYGLVSNGKLMLASCVGSLETNGYTLVEEHDAG